MVFSSSKKLKRSRTETESDYEGMASFPRFIITESTETPITNLSPFLIEKELSSNMTSIHVKRLKNQTQLVEVAKKKNADFLLKITKFHTINVKNLPSQILENM